MFPSGNCTWGMNCRFIHPGVNDKGNYSLITKPDLFPPNGAPPGGPHPLIPNSPWVRVDIYQYWWKHELMSETGKKKKREKSSINSDVKSFLLQRCRRDLQWRSSLHPLLLWSLLWRVHGSAVYGMPKRWMQLFIEPEMTGFNSLYIIVIIVIINVIIIIITYYIIII